MFSQERHDNLQYEIISLLLNRLTSSTDSDEETTQRQPAKFYFKRKLDACQMSPAVTHGVPKMQRENHAKQKIQKVVQRLENAFNTFVKNCVAIKIKLNAFKKALSD